MGLTEVPAELFRMKNVKDLSLYNNKLFSLPSEIAPDHAQDALCAIVEAIGS
jgi:hypothetical protein